MTRLVCLLPILGLCLACSAKQATPPASGLGPGVQVFPASQRSLLPRIQGATITGGTLDLPQELGTGLVAINVWASWCGPCRREMPLLVQASRTSLQVVGIDERDDQKSAQAFASSRHATYPSLSDPDGRLLAKLPMLPQTGVPSTLFLDRQGRVAARVVGPLDAATLHQLILRLGDTT